MAKKKKKQEDRVTLGEFRTAFKKATAIHAFIRRECPERKLPRVEFPGLQKQLESVFPTRRPEASVTVAAFHRNADRAIAQDNGRYQLVQQVMNDMPTLRRAFERERQEAAERRERAARRAASRPESLSDRVARLMRENADLRARLNNRPPAPEDDRAVREWYEKNDRRPGKSWDPDPPGLRD